MHDLPRNLSSEFNTDLLRPHSTWSTQVRMRTFTTPLSGFLGRMHATGAGRESRRFAWGEMGLIDVRVKRFRFGSSGVY